MRPFVRRKDAQIDNPQGLARSTWRNMGLSVFSALSRDGWRRQPRSNDLEPSLEEREIVHNPPLQKGGRNQDPPGDL